MTKQILMAFVTLSIFSVSLSTVALAEKKTKGKVKHLFGILKTEKIKEILNSKLFFSFLNKNCVF